MLGPKGEPGDTGASGLAGLPGMNGDAGMYDLVYHFYLNFYMSIFFYCRSSGKLMVDKQQMNFSFCYFRVSQALLVHRAHQVR
jgi:hypothetical protein